MRAHRVVMGATAQVIWLCACVRYWPDRILVPRAYDPSGLRQESSALGATILK